MEGKKRPIIGPIGITALLVLVTLWLYGTYKTGDAAHIFESLLGAVGSLATVMGSGLLLLLLYFLPAYIARRRRHRNGPAIFVLNLFLGWTFLGWVLALVWAYTSNVEEVPESTNTAPPDSSTIEANRSNEASQDARSGPRLL